MTIKVIKPGRLEDCLYHTTCRACKCEFTCNKTDGIYQPIMMRCEGDFVRVKCPTCSDDCIAYPVKTTTKLNDMREDDKPDYFYDR